MGTHAVNMKPQRGPKAPPPIPEPPRKHGKHEDIRTLPVHPGQLQLDLGLDGDAGVTPR